jgi:putative SOS response-associated peptidase YedK
MGPQLRDRHYVAQRALRQAAQPDAVVLAPESWPAWLGEEPADPAQLKSLLAPYPSDGMIVWPVSTLVGSVKNNDPSLVEPITLP